MSKPQACEGCPLYSAPGPVPSQGDYNEAKLVVITDKPSDKDAIVGLPFSDGVGNVFNRILYEAGIRRPEVFITSLIKCHGQLSTAAITHCSRFLDRDLERAKADTVLLLGDTPFATYIGSYSTLHPQYRPPGDAYTRKGCVEQREYPFKGGRLRKWIGTTHPRDYMRMVAIRDEVVEHYRKAYLLSGATIPMPKVFEHPTDQDIINAVELIKTNIGAFADDVETHQSSQVEEDDYVGGDYEVDMGGISYGEWNALVLDTNQLHLLAPLFSDPTLWRYEHNGMYDQYHFAKLLGHHTLYRTDSNIHPHNKWMDGMLAAHYHKSYKFKYLKPDCLSRYTRLPYYDRKLEKVSRRLYNGMDVIATHQECMRLKQLGQQEGWWDVFQRVGMEILPVLEEQRIIGVRTDVRKVVLFKRIFEFKMAKVRELAEKLVPGMEPFNPHHQKKLFYEFWKLPEQRDQRSKKVTTDYEARKRLAAWIDDARHPERAEKFKVARHLINLIDYYNGEKKKSEYLDRIDPDSRIHAFFKAHGERPFRLASKPNLQNFPVYDISDWGGARKANKGAADPLGIERKEYGSLRSLVLPDHDDDLILTIDFNQIQLWIYAALSGSKWLKEVYSTGDYIYGIVYDKLYKEPFFKEGQPRTKDNMRDDVPEQRIRRAKAVPLGFLFGRSAEAVATEYGWPLKEGYELRKWWFDNNPELLNSYADTEFQVKQKGYVKQAYGVRMYFPEGKVPEAINSKAQCGEAFIVMESMVLINKAFKERGWKNTRIMLSVHDAIAMNIAGARTNPQHLIDVYENIVLPICTRPIEQFGGWSFRIEGTVGTMWDYKVQKYPKWKKGVVSENSEGSGISSYQNA